MGEAELKIIKPTCGRIYWLEYERKYDPFNTYTVLQQPLVGIWRDVTPLFGARLVQEGHFRLHFLADRAGFSGVFSESDARHLDQAFPLFMKLGGRACCCLVSWSRAGRRASHCRRRN